MAKQPTMFHRMASEMALVHNCVLRGLNAIYLQAPHIKPEDEFSFANYMHQWYRMIHAHHSGEERLFFPAVERLTGIVGFMDVNIEQHKSFHNGLESFAQYIKALIAREVAYDGNKVVSLIDRFGKDLCLHLEEEIPTIISLEEFGAEKMAPVEKIFAQEAQEVMLPKDLDPEAEPVDESENESGSGESEDENVGTEHYVTVGKSKLREKEGVSLGPQYRGARVSRDALNDESDGSDVFEDAQERFDSNDEEYDDPENADLAADEAAAGDEDFEIASDNALGESDDEKLDEFVFRGSSQPKDKKKGVRSKRPTAADFITDEEEDNGDNEDEDEDEEDDDEEGGMDLGDEEDDEDGEEGFESSEDDLLADLEGSEGSDDDEDEDEDEEEGDEDSEVDSDDSDEDSKPRRKSNKADARAEQRKLMSEGQKALSATLSAAAQQDAQKGVAVREQRKTFDGLLNIRIRLQKAIVASNSFSVVDTDDFEQNSEPYEAAEEAALKLLNTLDSFRTSLLPAGLVQAGDKRKRSEIDTSTSSEDIWEGIQETEQRALKYRKKVLETWSTKTRSTTVEVKSRNLISQQSIVASLEEQLLNADRLIKRTRTPRSCAPAQVAKKLNEDPEIYDDADFYQLMLKQLVEQRTNDNGSTGAAAQPTVRWAAMKEAKTKKHVDRRASKGRKMRFNIHEKLQNFMAPEDRRMWEQDAVDRLFGTLFGQRMGLGEEASDEEMDDDVNAEEEGLRLFRN
ncbi:Protein BFR2 [Colletotrichum sp. SAR11_240]|nr:Protein BFR2 [Colletotrichum sp. SAR11_240]